MMTTNVYMHIVYIYHFWSWLFTNCLKRLIADSWQRSWLSFCLTTPVFSGMSLSRWSSKKWVDIAVLRLWLQGRCHRQVKVLHHYSDALPVFSIFTAAHCQVLVQLPNEDMLKLSNTASCSSNTHFSFSVSNKALLLWNINTNPVKKHFILPCS